MKNYKLFFCFLFPLALLAQKREGTFTPEQRATLKAKELRLQLDLSEKQENEIANYLKGALKNKPPKPVNPELRSQEDHYAHRLARLEERQELQEKMQSVLTEAQYAQWKKGHAQRGPRMGKRHHRMGKRMHEKEKHRQDRQGRPSPHKQTPSKNDSGY